MSIIETPAELRPLYRPANPRSVAKELLRLDRHCRRFIELSPFVVLGSSGQGGQDVSPRGGPPGFVRVLDENTLLIPDFPGNNRLDSLENIAAQREIGLLFLIPGIDETLRVNGEAAITTEFRFRENSIVDGKLPLSVLQVEVRQAYFHCGKALMRSGLWDPSVQVERSVLPSMGEILKEQTGVDKPAETQGEMVERYRQTLY